jgi:hypothetical protein
MLSPPIIFHCYYATGLRKSENADQERINISSFSYNTFNVW